MLQGQWNSRGCLQLRWFVEVSFIAHFMVAKKYKILPEPRIFCSAATSVRIQSDSASTIRQIL